MIFRSEGASLTLLGCDAHLGFFVVLVVALWSVPRSTLPLFPVVVRG